jgi:hypothetical protein
MAIFSCIESLEMQIEYEIANDKKFLLVKAGFFIHKEKHDKQAPYVLIKDHWLTDIFIFQFESRNCARF